MWQFNSGSYHEKGTFTYDITSVCAGSTLTHEQMLKLCIVTSTTNSEQKFNKMTCSLPGFQTKSIGISISISQ